MCHPFIFFSFYPQKRCSMASFFRKNARKRENEKIEKRPWSFLDFLIILNIFSYRLLYPFPLHALLNGGAVFIRTKSSPHHLTVGEH